jgi:hypothetical protein
LGAVGLPELASDTDGRATAGRSGGDGHGEPLEGEAGVVVVGANDETAPFETAEGMTNIGQGATHAQNEGRQIGERATLGESEEGPEDRGFVRHGMSVRSVLNTCTGNESDSRKVLSTIENCRLNKCVIVGRPWLV